MVLRNLRMHYPPVLRFAEANSRAVMPGNGNQSNALALSRQNLIKKSMLLLVALFIFTSVNLKAQSPQKINFQSIVRNTSGVIISNKSVRFKITIVSDSITGTPVYSETHLKTTDAIGLVSLQIGTGTVSSGIFSSLNWGNASHFIKLEADFTGGNTYVNLGTQELMSVPYAMYAAKTDTASLNLTNRFAEKAPVNNPTFTGTVSGIDKTMVGLGSVDNTTDVDKPVSSATQTALNAKVNIADTSTMLLNYRTGLNLKAPLASPTFTGTVSGIDKAMVGLGSVDNTTDASKPVSSATQTALALKAPLASPTFTGTVGGITKAMVGLENVDNTTDANKPVSTLTQTALAMKVNISDTSDMLDKYLRKADFPSGSNVGDFMYWNGTNWVGLAPGTVGQILLISSTGTPNWGCIVTNSADTASTNPTLVVNTALTAPITIATTGATGIDTIASGLPNGVTATWSANEITISGTPTTTGTFPYEIPLTGGCGNVFATGTITVTLAAACPTPTVEDIDGNIYNTVSIGNQCWMKENLRTRKYNDGTEIRFDNSGGTEGSTSQTWVGTGREYGAYTIYANDSTATTGNLAIYGYLYNWYAAKGIITAGGTSTKNVCPTGWHVPTDAEWTILIDTLGGDGIAGGVAKAGPKMKSKGTTYWTSESAGTDNSSGFSALPGGFRNDTDFDENTGMLIRGNFILIRDFAFFWSATESDNNSAVDRKLHAGDGFVYKTNGFSKSNGASVRCLKDSL